jgi:hypothetical protein
MVEGRGGGGVSERGIERKRGIVLCRERNREW